MIAFIDAYRDRFGVEFICTTLARHREGVFITARGYRAAKRRLPSKRSLRDLRIDPHHDRYPPEQLRRVWGG